MLSSFCCGLLQSHSGKGKDAKFVFVSPQHVDGLRWYHVLLMKQVQNFSKHKQFDLVEPDESSDEDMLEDLVEEKILRVGRKRVEETYGPELLTFIQNYAMTRGNLLMLDKNRLRHGLEMFDAPREQIVDEIRRKVGPVFVSIVQNLFLPKRKDAISGRQGSCRGVIPAKIGSVRISLAHWSALQR